MYSSSEHASFYETSKTFLKKELKAENIQELRKLLRYHEWKYYVKNDPVLSDFEYDQLYKKLVSLELEHPSLITPDSPTQRVSPDLTNEFPSVAHRVPMLSLDNSYDAKDLLKFDEQVRKLTGHDGGLPVVYCVEPKYDGGSISLLYENDMLVRAATRGNGVYGEEITPNARIMPSIPLNAPFSKYGIRMAEIRGEAVISKNKFSQINSERELDGLTLLANPRNSAAGGLRTKDPLETRKREIECFAFHLGFASGFQDENMLAEINTHYDQINMLSMLGFKTSALNNMMADNIEQVIKKVNNWEIVREDFPYEIDGAVVKVNSFSLQQLCGSTQHHPRWAIAFKFKAKQATTTLVNVEYQVGKIGSITPVAKVTPVHLAGVTVSSISMHNEEFITSKDLRLGDKIIIERAGDVIPYIVKPLQELRNGSEKPIEFPQYCPINNTENKVALIREEDESAWRCPMCVCGAQDLQKIIFHVSKNAMNVDGFGKSNVERFFELGWIRDIGDIYNLNYNDIAALDGFGQKSAENLKSAIEKAKNNSLSQLLHSLTIHHLGKKASKLIAEQIESIFELSTWKEEDYTNIKDIGPVVAKNVMTYFSDPANMALLEKLQRYGVNIHQTENDRPIEVTQSAPLFNKTILFTGSLQQMTRDEATKRAINAGAKPLSAVSSNLNILVVGEKAGSKLKKASDLGTVEIWTEEEFLNRVS